MRINSTQPHFGTIFELVGVRPQVPSTHGFVFDAPNNEHRKRMLKKIVDHYKTLGGAVPNHELIIARVRDSTTKNPPRYFAITDDNASGTPSPSSDTDFDWLRGNLKRYEKRFTIHNDRPNLIRLMARYAQEVFISNLPDTDDDAGMEGVTYKLRALSSDRFSGKLPKALIEHYESQPGEAQKYKIDVTV